MGKIAIAMLDKEILEDISTYANAENMSFIQAERALENMPHTRIGKILSEKWRLPLPVQNCVLYHHEANLQLRSGLSTEMHQYGAMVKEFKEPLQKAESFLKILESG